MKRNSLLLLVCACFLSDLSAQKVYNDQKEVLSSKSFNFYGYDVTKLELADGTRVGQDYQKFMVGFNDLMLKKFNQKEFEIIFKKGKNNIPFNPTPSQSGFYKMNFGKFVTQDCQKVSSDSLDLMVKNYQLPQTEGIGSVVIFDCFNRGDMTIDVSFLFFDISTRKIIYSKNLVSKDKNGYNYMADWKKAAIIAMERLLKMTAKDFDLYYEEQRKLKKGK